VEIAATEFKAKCLELINEVHDRKRNAVVITKRGKPFAKLVPVDESSVPFYGCMKGLAEIHGDLTDPTEGDWEALRD
jgi:prevent-host-death family protein